jgi:hypothetical protein
VAAVQHTFTHNTALQYTLTHKQYTQYSSTVHIYTQTVHTIQQYSTHLHTNSTQNYSMRRNTKKGIYITIRIYKIRIKNIFKKCYKQNSHHNVHITFVPKNFTVTNFTSLPFKTKSFNIDVTKGYD